MKRISFVLFCLSLIFISSCDDDKKSPVDNNNNGNFYVKFVNESNSVATISYISIQSLGPVIEGHNPQGQWSSNFLKSGETIAPGQHKFFYLDIPNKHWYVCRLGVLDNNNNTFLLEEQEDYQENITPTITHWGGDTRTVGVTLNKNSLGNIVIVGWSDWSGIE